MWKLTSDQPLHVHILKNTPNDGHSQKIRRGQRQHDTGSHITQSLEEIDRVLEVSSVRHHEADSLPCTLTVCPRMLP